MRSRRNPARCFSWIALLALLSFLVGACTSTPSKPPSIDPTKAEAPVIARILDRGEMRVGMTGKQPPFNFYNTAGKLRGFDVDLARLLARSMGVTAEFVVLPFDELLSGVTRGDLDAAISGLTITPERNMKVAFAGPYLYSGKSLVAKVTTLERLDSLEELNRKSVRLAALVGSTSAEFVRVATPFAILVDIQDYHDGTELVVKGKVDAMVADLPACMLAVLQRPEAKLATLTPPLSLEPIGVAIPPFAPLFANLMENFMKTFDASGLREQMEQKWFNDDGWLQDLGPGALTPKIQSGSS